VLHARRLLLVSQLALLDSLWRSDEYSAEYDSELLWGELVLVLACEHFSEEGDDVEEGVVVNVRQFCDQLLRHEC